MLKRKDLANYRVHGFVLVFIVFLSFIYVLYSSFSINDNNCVIEHEGFNLMDNFNEWIPHVIGREGVWDSGVEVPINENGYPRTIPFKSGTEYFIVKTVLGKNDNKLIEGVYTFSFEGTGEIKLGFDAESKVFNESGSYTVNVVSSGRGVYLEILKSDILDPIKNIKLVTPIVKEIGKCNINQEENITQTHKGVKFLVVNSANDDNNSNSEVVEMIDYSLKDKVVTGFVTFFVILALIYILK